MKWLGYIAIILVLSACTESEKKNIRQRNYFEGPTMGANYSVTYTGMEIKELQGRVEKLLESFNRSVNTYDSTSLISRINRNELDVLDSFNLQLFIQAFDLAKQSEGAFDITVAPLVNAWGFGFKNQETITPNKIGLILQSVGYRKVNLQMGKVIKRDSNTMFDYNSIAPGYAADLIGYLLDMHKITDYMINVGGEIVCKGLNAEGKVWNIGIERPVENKEGTNPFEAIIQVKDRALATSGNYRRFYYKDGKRYAHTIDPRTGYPVQHNLLSATILAPTGMRADALATTCMVLGPVEAEQFLQQRYPDCDYYFIYDEQGKMKEKWSSGLDSLIQADIE